MPSLFPTQAKTTHPKAQFSAADLIQYRYQFYLSVLKGMVRYGQEAESMTRSQIIDKVDAVADKLISKYRFGGKFMSEIKCYINQRYIKPNTQVFEQIKEESDIPEDAFLELADDLDNDGVLQDVREQFSPRFRSIWQR